MENKIPKKITEEHTSVKFFENLLGYRIYTTKGGSNLTERLEGIMEVCYAPDNKQPPLAIKFTTLKREVELPWIVVVSLIEYRYSVDNSGFHYIAIEPAIIATTGYMEIMILCGLCVTGRIEIGRNGFKANTGSLGELLPDRTIRVFSHDSAWIRPFWIKGRKIYGMMVSMGHDEYRRGDIVECSVTDLWAITGFKCEKVRAIAEALNKRPDAPENAEKMPFSMEADMGIREADRIIRRYLDLTFEKCKFECCWLYGQYQIIHTPIAGEGNPEHKNIRIVDTTKLSVFRTVFEGPVSIHGLKAEIVKLNM